MLLCEFRLGGTSQWRRLGALTAAQQPGSISNRDGGGRDVILFRCCGPYSLIEQSLAGADLETGPDRVIATEGTVVLATLHEGDSYEMDVRSDSGRWYTARWTHQATL